MIRIKSYAWTVALHTNFIERERCYFIFVYHDTDNGNTNPPKITDPIH